MAFGTKTFTGVGYPTPVSIPEGTTCLILQVPASAEWWALTIGVLYTLTLEWEWQQFEGALTREECAARWNTMLDDAVALASVGEECSAVVSAPYWDEDTGDDADDELPVDDQPWYGILIPGESGLTWQEQVSVWIVTAFVAYAATPAAAIAFLPIAKRMVLAFRQHDLGGIVRVFVDGIEARTVDTYSPTPDVIEIPLAIPETVGGMGAADTLHTIWVEMSEDVNPAVMGAPNIQVIRKRLTASEFSNPNLRYDPDCNCVQATYDDGETWFDNPGADPRYSPVYTIPPVPDARCPAAGGMVELTRRHIALIEEGATVLGVSNAVLAILAVITGGAGIIVDLIIAVVDALIVIGAATIQGAFNDEAYGNLLCAFYCNISPDGGVEYVDIAAIQAQIDDQIGGTVSIVMALLFGIWGNSMLQNAGVQFADPDADCSDCDCCVTPTTVSKSGGTWGTFPTGIITSGIVQPGNGYIYASNSAPLVVGFDHAVLVTQFDIANAGSYNQDITLHAGTASKTEDFNANFGSHSLTVDPPQLLTEVSVTTVPGIGLAFGNVTIHYCEPS